MRGPPAPDGLASGILGCWSRDSRSLPRRVMNGPADGEVDYKKKYRNLKRKLKFLIYVSARLGSGDGMMRLSLPTCQGSGGD